MTLESARAEELKGILVNKKDSEGTLVSQLYFY